MEQSIKIRRLCNLFDILLPLLGDDRGRILSDQWVESFHMSMTGCLVCIGTVSEWLIVVKHQMSNISAMSWQEQATFNEMTMLSALY